MRCGPARYKVVRCGTLEERGETARHKQTGQRRGVEREIAWLELFRGAMTNQEPALWERQMFTPASEAVSRGV